MPKHTHTHTPIISTTSCPPSHQPSSPLQSSSYRVGRPLRPEEEGAFGLALNICFRPPPPPPPPSAPSSLPPPSKDKPRSFTGEINSMSLREGEEGREGVTEGGPCRRRTVLLLLLLLVIPGAGLEEEVRTSMPSVPPSCESKRERGREEERVSLKDSVCVLCKCVCFPKIPPSLPPSLPSSIPRPQRQAKSCNPHRCPHFHAEGRRGKRWLRRRSRRRLPRRCEGGREGGSEEGREGG